MAQLKVYMDKKVAAGKNPPLYMADGSAMYKGRLIIMGDNEIVGRVVGLKHSLALGVGIAGDMEAAVNRSAVCFYRPADMKNCVNARFFYANGTLSPAYQFGAFDISKCLEDFQSVEMAIKLHESTMIESSEENKKKYQKELDEILKKLQPITQPFNQINFLNISTFETQRAKIQAVCQTESGSLLKYGVYYGDKLEDVIENEKETGDFLMYLPTQWTDACGYSPQSVKRWIDFVNAFGLPAQLEYLGVQPCNDYKEYPTLADFKYGGIDPGSVINKNEYHHVKINTCECGTVNHFVWRLIISLYHTWTRWIPGIAMQLKDEIGEEVSEWDAYLLAVNADTSGALAEVRPAVTQRPKYVKVFSTQNDVSEVVRKLYENKIRPGQALSYKEFVVEKAKIIDDAFAKQDYKSVYDIFRKSREGR
jgi:hypothetical protein